jgi:hypothetical protein
MKPVRSPPSYLWDVEAMRHSEELHAGHRRLVLRFQHRDHNYAEWRHSSVIIRLSGQIVLQE